MEHPLYVAFEEIRKKFEILEAELEKIIDECPEEQKKEINNELQVLKRQLPDRKFMYEFIGTTTWTPLHSSLQIIEQNVNFIQKDARGQIQKLILDIRNLFRTKVQKDSSDTNK